MPTKVLVDTDSSQTLTNKTFTAPTITAGVVALAAAPTATLDAATKGYVDGTNINPLNNGSLHATVVGNALTFWLKTAGGAAPSATDPVRVTFRNTTDADGTLVTRTVTAAIVLTFSSGSTMGMTSAVAGRIWVGLIDNAGSVEICAWNPYNTSSQNSLKAFTPNTDVTTTAEGSGTATSAHVLYSTNARSAVPFVLLGYIEITEASAGVWATAPTVIQTYRDGMRKTGDILQAPYMPVTAMSTGTTTIPYDDTIPQNTEGDQYISLAMTPVSAVNVLRFRGALYGAHTSGAHFVAALFQDSTANALAIGTHYTVTAAAEIEIPVTHRMLAGTTSSTTFKIRAGSDAAGTFTLNGAGGARKYGGVLTSFLEIEEVMA